MTSVLLYLSALASLVYGTRYFSAPGGALKAAIKTTAVGALALHAFLADAPGLLVAALVLSSLGDFFLAFDGETPFLAGLGSFLAAHVAYIALFRRIGLPLEVIGEETWRLVGVIAIVAVCLALLVGLWRHLGPMRGPVVVYTAVIVTMVASALALSGHGSVVIGAFAFAASDACLAVVTFRPKQGHAYERVLPLVVWWLYWGAQVAITAGFVVMRLG